MADVVTPNSIPSTLTRWIYIDMEHRKTICTSPNCMRAIPPDRIVSHCSKKHKKWSSKQQLRAFMEFVEQLGWSPSRDDEVTEDGLAPHPHLPVMDGLQCQHCPIRFQLLESEAAYQHRRIHGSLVGCMERVLVRIQSWSGDGPYWVVNESECGLKTTAPGVMMKSSEHEKLEMDEHMDEQADRTVEDLPTCQAGIGDACIDVDGDDWVLLELPGQT